MDRSTSGAREETLKSYRTIFKVLFKYIDPDIEFTLFKRTDLQRVILSLDDGTRSKNTIRTYTAHLAAFLNWARKNGYTDLELKPTKAAETVPDLYTRDELERLLKKPDMKKCTFCDYRNWVIVCLLVNNGMRAGTIRAIQNRDVNLDDGAIYLRHMKNGRTTTAPLGEKMRIILMEYMNIRKGFPGDPLFPEADGRQFSQNGLRYAIERYNHSRGVETTGLHRFRHTFARWYLIDCGGDALKLQKLLGHTTLKMTQHYMQIFDRDLILDFEKRSPLDNIMNSHIKMRK